MNFLLSNGDRIRSIVGEEYDLVAFDPRYGHCSAFSRSNLKFSIRGVARSTPRIAVFSDPAQGATWNFNTQLVPLPNMTADAIARIRARALIYNSIAKTSLEEEAQHVGTAAVARDMLSIVRAHGRERLFYWGFS